MILEAGGKLQYALAARSDATRASNGEQVMAVTDVRSAKAVDPPLTFPFIVSWAPSGGQDDAGGLRQQGLQVEPHHGSGDLARGQRAALPARGNDD
jgi:hypothetical protein